MKKLISILLVMATLMSFTLCAIDAVAISKVNVSNVRITNLTGKAFYVAKGKRLALKTQVTVNPNNSKYKGVIYKSSNTGIAKVNSKGVVTGVKAGVTKITVTSKINNKKRTTVNVRVTNPVTRLTLSRTTATLLETKSFALKPKFTPSKGICTAVKYTTSNSRIARVNQKGVVTALKPGTVKITATTVDGTSKRAVCTVKVNPIYSLKSINAKYDSNGYTRNLSFTLNRAKRLSVNSISIYRKKHGGNYFKNKLNIDQMITFDNKTYHLVLDFGDDIYCGDSVKITINTLSGVKSKVYFYNSTNTSLPSSSYIRGNVGEYCYSTFSHSSRIGTTRARIVSGSLPKGIKFENIYYNKYCFKGVFRETCNNTSCIVEITDEYNHKLLQKIVFIVGDKNHIYGTKKTLGTKSNPILGRANRNSSYPFSFMGGSGKYKLSLENDYDGLFSISKFTAVKNDYCYLYIINDVNNPNIKPRYDIVINITDANDESIKGKATFPVFFTEVKRVNVFHDKEYLSSKNYSILAIDCKDQSKYYKSFYDDNPNAETLYLPVGYYNIYRFSYAGETSLLVSNYRITKDVDIKGKFPKTYSVTFSFKDKNNNGVMPNYDLKITNATTGCSYEATGYNKEEKEYDGLLAGERYIFEFSFTNKFSLKEMSKTTKTFTMTGNKKSTIIVDNSILNDMPKADKELKGAGSVEMEVTNDSYAVLKFIPTETRKYTIYSTGDLDTYARCYKADYHTNVTISDDDDGEKTTSR